MSWLCRADAFDNWVSSVSAPRPSSARAALMCARTWSRTEPLLCAAVAGGFVRGLVVVRVGRVVCRDFLGDAVGLGDAERLADADGEALDGSGGTAGAVGPAVSATNGASAERGTVASASACLARPMTVNPVPITTAVAPATSV